MRTPTVAVVIPCFRVKRHIADVIGRIGPEVHAIFVVDDRCPEGTGDFVAEHVHDPRVRIVRHSENRGVGGAVMSGYAAAIAEGFDIAVKIDGDGQMDPALVPLFVAPIASGRADYTKGNRFWDLEQIGQMPPMRLFGNAALSFLTKFSSGYWHTFDPTNGYTAIHLRVASHLPMARIAQRYFFESDMLFRLNTLRAVVLDVPMDAKYGDEVSNLRIGKVLPEFLWLNLRNTVKRIFYNYYLRDMSLASLELPAGIVLAGFGTAFGLYHWAQSFSAQHASTAGTVMLSALPVLLGLQLLLAFVGHDVRSVPRDALHPLLRQRIGPGAQ